MPTYKISREWAKQLAYFVWPWINFETVNMLYCDSYAICIPVIVETSWQKIKEYTPPPSGLELETEIIDLRWVHDPINGEDTRLGYGLRTKSLCIGRTRKAKWR